MMDVANANAVAAGCDVLCTATSVAVGAGPVFDTVDTRSWLHVNAIGSDFPGKTELPRALLQQSLVCADFVEQAVREGECQQLDPETLGPDLATLVRQSSLYEQYRSRRTVFDSTGFAVEDEVALAMLLFYAKELGLGTRMQIESDAHDPHDPYAFVNDPAALLRGQSANQSGWV
jgi:ornithine cyclodeaminase/alanine dehydrogenase-like protein (mu-crystallin family)